MQHKHLLLLLLSLPAPDAGCISKNFKAGTLIIAFPLMDPLKTTADEYNCCEWGSRRGTEKKNQDLEHYHTDYYANGLLCNCLKVELNSIQLDSICFICHLFSQSLISQGLISVSFCREKLSSASTPRLNSALKLHSNFAFKLCVYLVIMSF